MDYQQYIKEKIDKHNRTRFYDVCLTLVGHPCKSSYPRVQIDVNDTRCYDDIVKGEQVITFVVKNYDIDQMISISMVEKDIWDTLSDNTGTIIEDKRVEIKKVKLAGVDIRELIYTAKQYPIYKSADKHLDKSQTGPEEIQTTILHYEGAWQFKYKSPPIPYFADKQLQKSLFSKDAKVTSEEKTNKKYSDMAKFVKGF